MLLILITIIFSILSAFAYRIGGMSKEEAKAKFPWFPQVLVKSWFRDVNCTLLSIGWYLLFLPKVDWWWYILAAGAQYGATTTYWDDSFINWMKPEDNFYLHGAFIALATLFVAIPAGAWIGAIIRILVLGLFMGLWCKYFSDVYVEEYGRGASIQASLPLLLIGA